MAALLMRMASLLRPANEDDATQLGKIKIVQWNQKDLTRTDTEPHKERIDKVARTIRDMAPDVCVLEEVVSGGGGERAVKEIVAKLNEYAKSDDWRYALSNLVDPMKTKKKEHYAVIWQKASMGDQPLHYRKNGEVPLAGQNILANSDSFSPDPPQELEIDGVKINLAGPRGGYSKLHERFPDLPGCFDRCPVVSSFGIIKKKLQNQKIKKLVKLLTSPSIIGLCPM